MSTAFETENCSRCGGTGQYSFNGEHSRCYKCNGDNGCKAYTKRGAAAKAFYLELRNKPIAATDVVVGMRVVVPGWKWMRVASVTVGSRNSIKRDENNNIVRFEKPRLFFTNADGGSSDVDVESTLTVFPSTSENEIMIASAIAYQATLTKTGAVRKIKEKA
jgi:hypothetical protein